MKLSSNKNYNLASKLWCSTRVMSRHTSIKAIKYANKTFIQEIDAMSSTNIMQHAFIKFSTVAADINHTSPKYTCHKINIHP